MSLLPQESLEKLRCSLCLNFLSIPPITTISSNGVQHKCGRCSYLETPINNANSIYEAAAQIALFPCTFPNCKEVLAWGEAQGHELVCPYRTMKCPISWRCDEIVNVLGLVEHSSLKHHKNVCDNILTTPIDIIAEGKKKFTIMLLLKDRVPFLVYTVVTLTNVWINVFSLYPQRSFNYELELISRSSNECCLSFKNKVIPFNPRLHCKECILKECTNRLHEKSDEENKISLDEYMQGLGCQKIKRELVTELNLKELRYTVSEENGAVDNAIALIDN